MNIFSNAAWVWHTAAPAGLNAYCEFTQNFTCDGSHAVCRISADSDYVLYLNGQFVSANQYGDFEYYKSYDELDLTPYLKKGENRLAVLVWHYGEHLQRYYLAPAGLIFEVEAEGKLLAASGKCTLARESRTFAKGEIRKISPQLGRTFAYDATKGDDWITADAEGFAPAALVEKHCDFVPRPIKLPVFLPAVTEAVVSNVDNKHFVIDMGREVVGPCTLSFSSPVAQSLLVSWGEHLTDGHVSRIIGARDFSFDYHAKAGENSFTNYLLRLGCRYLEIDCEEPIELHRASIIPQVYPVGDKPAKLQSAEDQRIYDLCLRTLHLCIMDRYVDCPWREQCLYALDSRNQMLFGYYGLENGNAEYVRANILLMSKDRRQDALLSICSPCGVNMTIPSFSLHHVLQTEEYLRHTGDVTLPLETYDKLSAILGAFLAQEKDGLICAFEAKEHWNFYDWSPHSDGHYARTNPGAPDGVLNALTVLALDAFESICEKIGKPFPFTGRAERIRRAAHDAFYCKEEGCFSMSKGGNVCTEVVNILAILSDVATAEERVHIAAALQENKLPSCALAMKLYKYEALCKADEARYRDFILADIRADYGMMLANGATSTWETIKGREDFLNAGSLCHAWTATPIYIFHKFGMVK
ncbi:MAG: hypothetical protein IJY16_01770 [Clostridia bacterium]|nr:hypothetical protein [Clostridia bacterium]